MEKKLADPEYIIPYIPRTKKVYPYSAKKKNRTQQSPIWLPFDLRNKDLSEFELDAQQVLDKYAPLIEEEAVTTGIPRIERPQVEIDQENLADKAFKTLEPVK